MAAVPLQRAFDLSVGFVLTLRAAPSPVTDEDAATFRRVTARRWWKPSTWHRRRPVPPSPTQSFTVPPLTLGRFLDLMASDWNAVAHSILDSKLLLVAGDSAAEILGRQLAGVDHRAFTGPVCAVVPGMTRETWERYGSTVEAYRLIHFFHKTHDWNLIGKAIGWGEAKADEETPTRASVTAALLSFCRTFPTQSVEDLLATRVEGFFYLRDGANETLRGPEELEDGDILQPGQGIADGAGLVNDPARRSPLWGAIDAADKAVQ